MDLTFDWTPPNVRPSEIACKLEECTSAEYWGAALPPNFRRSSKREELVRLNFVESAHYSIRFNCFNVRFSLLIFYPYLIISSSFSEIFQSSLQNSFYCIGIASNNFNLNQVLTLSYDFCEYCEVYPIKINLKNASKTK